MQQSCTLYIVRHGESVANREHVVGGHFDSPLSPTGEDQARETRELLGDVYFDDVYSSDLCRASQTAAIVYGREVPKDHQLFDLRERNFGKLEGGPIDGWTEVDTAYREKYESLPFEERIKHDYADYIEGDGPLCDRFMKALRQIAASHSGQTVLVATHGGCIRVLLMKLGYASFLAAGSFKNAGYVELTCDGGTFEIKEVAGIQQPLGAE
jgi:broad specificity phosphatase PhoE